MLAPWCAIACATHRAEHRELESVWRDYRALPDQRALAIAGVIERNSLVAGASGGHASSDAARAGALRECQLRRQRMRMQHPCRVYAVGDEVVWGEGRAVLREPVR
jgi:hypothetical protein